MTEGLPSVGVGNVNLHHGTGKGSEGVAEGHRCVGVSTGVDQNSVAHVSIRLQTVDELPFVVALEKIDAMPGKFHFQLGQEFIKRPVAVPFGLPFTHEIQVGAIDNQDVHCDYGFIWLQAVMTGSGLQPDGWGVGCGEVRPRQRYKEQRWEV